MAEPAAPMAGAEEGETVATEAAAVEERVVPPLTISPVGGEGK